MKRALLAGVIALGAGSLLCGACGGSQNATATARAPRLVARLGDGGARRPVALRLPRARRSRGSRDCRSGRGAAQRAPRLPIVGAGDSAHKVLICREIDTNLDGIKDIVRTYTEKGESLREEADTNYDGRIDTWITFSGGRIAKEEIDTDFDGNARRLEVLRRAVSSRAFSAT